MTDESRSINCRNCHAYIGQTDSVDDLSSSDCVLCPLCLCGVQIADLKRLAEDVNERLTGLLSLQDLDEWLNLAQTTVLTALRDRAKTLSK